MYPCTSTSYRYVLVKGLRRAEVERNMSSEKGGGKKRERGRDAS